MGVGKGEREERDLWRGVDSSRGRRWAVEHIEDDHDHDDHDGDVDMHMTMMMIVRKRRGEDSPRAEGGGRGCWTC